MKMDKERISTQKAMDGGEAVARIAYALSQVIAIYPITPSSAMGETSDAWAAAGKKNFWDVVPRVMEMQSEAGAAGTVHGSVTAGAATTTFTSSQGLLLMIPNMYKIAGELTPTVFHIAARTIATHALSIFGDQSDIMATRQTGFAILGSCSVQEAHDLALIAHASTLESRIPFAHVFDGFRTSHEIQKIETLGHDDIAAVIDDEALRQFRERSLDPEHSSMRGTSQNPDVFFQSREAINPFYLACPETVEKVMKRFEDRTGRAYRLFDYVGAPDAERVIIVMGSAAEATTEAVEALVAKGEKVGLIKIRLYRPFSTKHLIEALPATVKSIAVLDRTKEPGSVGEPIYLDVLAAIDESRFEKGAKFADRAPRVIGGRYGLSSKEYTPAMAAAILAELKKENPKRHFTIGINDDVTKLSLEWDESFSTEDDETCRAVFYGLGSDGTVSANKNSIKIIAEGTDLQAQGFFVYDSKKAGSTTTSHLRFGPKKIRSTYLIQAANFVACHQEKFLKSVDVFDRAAEGAVFLLNTSTPRDKIWDSLPNEVQKQMIDKKVRFYVVDAYKVAAGVGLGVRINTVMQTCFFKLADIIPDAADRIKQAIRDTYGKKSAEIAEKNFLAVDQALAHLHEVAVPKTADSKHFRPPAVPKEAPDFLQRVTSQIIAGRGDKLPVSAFPVDGVYPIGTTQWEKRNLAVDIPIWDEQWCIQCNKCAIVCPHAAIRVKAYPKEALETKPEGFKSMIWKGREFPKDTMGYTVQVAPEDCTGCNLCVDACPAKNRDDKTLKAINMLPHKDHKDHEVVMYDYFLNLPETDREKIAINSVKGSQLAQPMFEYSGACLGCGETPYLKLMTQMFGDRLAVANATGCSSIYGGNLPTTPWTCGADGRGPAWSNSLFEDNAEFGLGYRLAYDSKRQMADTLLEKHGAEFDADLVKSIREAVQVTEGDYKAQRERVSALKKRCLEIGTAWSKDLYALSDGLVRKVVWIVGGDGWAYDIGFGGLDHVIASGEDVNILVMDTEGYANTGGQASKATPRAAVAKFASAGKQQARKDLAWAAMGYGSVYVARVAMGSSDAQTVKAFAEAEAYPGPSIIIAYSHCIEHGVDLALGMQQQKLAVDSGYWPLFRYDPRKADAGANPLQLDSKGPKIPFKDYAYNEGRYKRLSKTNPEEAARLLVLAEEDVKRRWKQLEDFSKLKVQSES